MEYVFGVVRRFGEDVENLKTKGDKHTDLSGRVIVRREYPDRIIEDTCFIREKYESKESDGVCYDFYLIDNHTRDTDMFTPMNIEEKIAEVMQSVVDVEIDQMEAGQMLVDHEIAIMELQDRLPEQE